VELIFTGFPSIDLIKKINTSDKIIENKDLYAAGNYIDGQRKILFIDATNVSALDRSKVWDFVKNFRKDLSFKILIVQDELESKESAQGILTIKRQKNESSEKCVIEFGKKMREALSLIVGNSSHVKTIRRNVFDITFSGPHVLILGETGTGKNLLASVIHKASIRSGEIVSLNLTTLPESLLESELFGHAKGAYTGADSSREGLMAKADRGHFFLDEIGELPLPIQAKLLNVIEDGKYHVVGGLEEKKVDIKFISATNRDLSFIRKDLFYRLAEDMIELVPLRNRKDDVPALVDFFLKNLDYDMKFGDLPTEIQSKLMDYNYPGNVRELQNIIKRYLSKGELDLQAEKNNVSVYSNSISNRAYQIIDDSVTDMIEKITSTHDLPPLVELKEKILSKVEVEYVRHVLNIFKWDKQKAAAKLGISYRYLNKLVIKYNMDRRAPKKENSS